MPDNIIKLKTQDRELLVEIDLEENTMVMRLELVSKEQPHMVRIVFTKGFARELRTFLNEKLGEGETHFGELE